MSHEIAYIRKTYKNTHFLTEHYCSEMTYTVSSETLNPSIPLHQFLKLGKFV